MAHRLAAGPLFAIIACSGQSTAPPDLVLVIPGINDAHVHPGAGPPMEQLEGPSALVHDPTLAEVLERVKAAVGRARRHGWIMGKIGSAILDEPQATRFALDAVAPEHPSPKW